MSQRGACGSLLALLTLPRLMRVEATWARRCCSHPGVLSSAVRARLRHHGLPTPTPRIGDPLIVTAVDGKPTGALWRLLRADERQERERQDQDGLLPLVGKAQASWRRAGQLVPQALPLIADVDALAPEPDPSFWRLDWPADGAHASLVEGPSAGLAFALARASALLGLPIPADVACTAELRENGGLGLVGGLSAKRAALAAWAPGVRRLLVARGTESAETEVTECGIRLVPVGDLREAIREVWGDRAIEDAARRRWEGDGVADRAAEQLFHLALYDHDHPNRWEVIRRSTGLLTEVLRRRAATRPEIFWQARFADAVAGRHCGDAVALPAIQELPRQLRRPIRLTALAHLVQTCNNTADEAWRALAEEALAAVAPPLEEHAEDLKLLGAIGRLYAAWGEWDDAVRHLRRAIEGWMELNQPIHASHAICALFWVAGLRPQVSEEGDRGDIDEAAAWSDRLLRQQRLSTASRAFLQIARGIAGEMRGLGQHGAHLRDPVFDQADAPHQVQAVRLWWFARQPGSDLERLRAVAAQEATCQGYYALAAAERGDLSVIEALKPEVRRRINRRIPTEPNAGMRRRAELFLV